MTTTESMPTMAVEQAIGHTEYFEIDSEAVGARFAIWVTTSPTYAQDESTYPALYVTDGNFSVGLTAPLAVMQSDVMLSISPYLQVTVGYLGEEAADWGRVRNRDLVPPGEPIAPAMRSALDLAVENGLMTAEQVDAYLADLANTHADHFLTFLTDELHPEITRRYRVSAEGHGLFGYSYGGLFSLYALLAGETPFSAFGAGSPGIASAESTVLKLAEDTASMSGKRLHLTVNSAEITGEMEIYREIGRGFASLIDILRSSESGVSLTTAVLGETHVTGLQASFLSFMRNCWTSPA